MISDFRGNGEPELEWISKICHFLSRVNRQTFIIPLHPWLRSIVQFFMCSRVCRDTWSSDATKFLDLVSLLFFTHCSSSIIHHVFFYIDISFFRTLITHSFLEIHFWHTIIDILVILFYTKMIDTLWGTKESIKFYFIVTIPNAILATTIYFILYGITFNEEYLFERPIYGSAAFIGGYSVVIKQIVPDTTLATTPFFKFKQDQIPLLIVFLTTFAWIGNGVPNHFLIMLTLGIFIGWTYLR